MIPTVSIIIPTYNQAGLLKFALQSVKDQDFPDWEAIVVDNFSDDNTGAIVTQMKDDRITYLRFHNNGIIAASRNRGIQQARGKFIAFLDSDDLWYPAKITRCLEMLGTGTQIVSHRLRIRKNGVLTTGIIPQQITTNIYETLLFSGNTSIATSAVMVEKDCLDRFGNFSEKLEMIAAEDYDLWLRLAKNHVVWGFLPDLLGEYTIHAGNTSRGVQKQMLAEETVVISHFREEKGTSWQKRFLFRKRVMMISFQAARRMITRSEWRSVTYLAMRGFYAWLRKY